MAKKAKISIKVTKLHLYIGFIAIIFIGTAVYSYIKYNELTFKQSVIAENQQTIENLKVKLDEKDNEYFEVKKEHDESEALIVSAISKIFPQQSDQNNLLRDIENFFVKNHLTSSYSFLSSINFESVQENDEWEYRILPFTMSIESSESNFYKFLEYLETSGSLENEVRIMDVENISLNFGGEGASNYTFNVKANAYFQKEVEVEAPEEENEE